MFQFGHLFWMLLCSSVSYQEVQHWTQYSRCLARAERMDHLSHLADDALPNVFHKTVGLLCQEGPFLAHGQLFTYWDPLHFCRVACQPPACPGAWSCCSLGAGSAVCLYRISQCSWQNIPLTCWDHFEWQCCPWMYSAFPNFVTCKPAETLSCHTSFSDAVVQCWHLEIGCKWNFE